MIYEHPQRGFQGRRKGTGGGFGLLGLVKGVRGYWRQIVWLRSRRQQIMADRLFLGLLRE
jgi:hypothetical protein